MLANPIIRRFYFSQFRPGQLWVFGTLYAGMVLLLLFINTSVYRYGEGYSTLMDLYRGLFLQFAVLEVFLLWLLCPANCSNVVSREIADKSFDFFRMLPLSAARKTVGIVVGRNLFTLLLSVVNLLICLACAIAGQLSGAFILQMLALLLASAAALNLTALMFGVISFRKSKATSIPVLLVIGLFAFGPIVGFIMDAVHEEKVETLTAHFFWFEMPLLYVISLCVLYVAVWAYIGTVRRFTFEYESLFSRSGAAVFLLSFLILLMGLFYKTFYIEENTSPDSALRAFWLIGLLPVWVIPVLAVRSFDKYLEISRRVSQGLFSRLALGSNLATGLILFAIWLAFGGAVCLSTHCIEIEFICFAGMALSFFLVILAMLETHTLLVAKNEKIGFLIGFLAVLYCFLPLILDGIFELEIFSMLSPLQMLGFLDMHGHRAESMAPPLALNAILLGLFSIPIIKRYRDLIAIRTGMRNAA